MHFCCETFLFYCYSLFIYSFYSGRMRDHSSSPWLTALCCRSFGLSLAFLAVGSFSLEPHRSAAKLCSFSWAWISACTRRMAWVRVQDHTLCQVPKLTNYQGKNKRAVTACFECNEYNPTVSMILPVTAAVRWCLAVDTRWPTSTVRGRVKFAFGDVTFSWVSWTWKTRQEKLWMKTDGSILETWGR